MKGNARRYGGEMGSWGVMGVCEGGGGGRGEWGIGDEFV